MKAATDAQLLEYLAAPGAILRLHAQRAILRRGEKPAFTRGLGALASDDRASLAARVAAVSAAEVHVRFERPGPAVTPGQAAVFYRGDLVLGGGWIAGAIQ